MTLMEMGVLHCSPRSSRTFTVMAHSELASDSEVYERVKKEQGEEE